MVNCSWLIDTRPQHQAEQSTISNKILLSKIKRFLNKPHDSFESNILKFNEITMDMDSYSTFVNQKNVTRIQKLKKSLKKL